MNYDHPLRIAVFVLCLSAIGDCYAIDFVRSPQLQLNVAGHTATVRSLSFTPDSRFLCSGGMDKVVQVWRVPRTSDQVSDSKQHAARRLINERTLRWEIAAGLRGSIYATACSPKTGKLAIAGFGARGTTGEIILADPELGRFEKPLDGHRETVARLCYSTCGEWLASVDVSGRTLLWRDVSEPLEITPADEKHYGYEAALQIQPYAILRNVAIAGDRFLVVPIYVGQARGGVPIWKLRLHSLEDDNATVTLQTKHYGTVTALAASSDGRFLASADSTSKLYVWDLQAKAPAAKSLPTQLTVLSMAFSPQGTTLAAGTTSNGKGSELQIWDVQRGSVRKKLLGEPVYTTAISPNGKWVAFSGNKRHRVFVEQLTQRPRRYATSGGVEVGKVALAERNHDYRVQFAKRSRGAPVVKSFDPATLRLVDVRRDDVDRRLLGTRAVSEWSLRHDNQKTKLDVYHSSRLVCSLKLDPTWQGRYRCHCWLNGKDGQPAAIAIGTESQNRILVYPLSNKRSQHRCTLLRQFRGHSAPPTSLAVAADGRYLVSSSTDGTVRYWPLNGLRNKSVALRRWGAQLVRRDGKLIAHDVSSLGPLYRKGIRTGDVIRSIEYIPLGSSTKKTSDRPDEILDLLTNSVAHQQIAFETFRDGKVQPPFNCRPAWDHILAVFAVKRDWIAWNPAGYYACSPGGERLVGWQVNNGFGRRPSFFAAVRFSKTFFRPDVVRLLLDEGDVAKALAKVGDVRQDIAAVLPPRVHVLSPAESKVVQNSPRLEIVATAETFGEHPVKSMRLLLDGRPYLPRQTVKGDLSKETPTQQTWQLNLPPGKHRIAVLADTDVSQGRSAEIEVQYDAPATKPALYVLAIGISKYPDRMALRYAHQDAKSIARVFESCSHPLFGSVQVKQLTNEQATKTGINAGLKWLSKNVTVRDVGIVFFSGHGVTDKKGDFFLFPCDGRRDEIARSCVSAKTIKKFCEDTPGRLVLMLDACHSGGLRLGNISTAGALTDNLVRELAQDDYGVIVMASSKGSEASVEDQEWQSGAFTKALKEGLQGSADFDGDSYVWVNEVDTYVFQRVQQLTKKSQTPVSAKPLTLAPFRLTQAKSRAQSKSRIQSKSRTQATSQ